MNEYAYAAATQRKHEAGARAVGCLQALLRLDEIPAYSRAPAQRIIDAWNAAHQAALDALAEKAA